MSDTEVAVAEPKKSGMVAGKRGLDLGKIEFMLGREQEADLRLIFRCDSLKLFQEMAPDERKKWDWKKMPSDPPIIQAIWEANSNYKRAQAACEENLALKWFDKLTDLILRVQDMRKDAMDRMHIWKKHAEERGASLDGMSIEELAKVANE